MCPGNQGVWLPDRRRGVHVAEFLVYHAAIPMMRRFLLAIPMLVAACGARTRGLDGAPATSDLDSGSAGGVAGGAGSSSPGVDAESGDGGGGGLVALDGAAPTEGGVFGPMQDGGPQSCADIGKFPGKANCCGGAYCAGGCNLNDCVCGTTIGGCIWPAVCCKGLCVGAAACP